jgi:type II secretory pathway pseudopilin PulG
MRRDDGYAMAALLVAIAVIAVMLSAAVPVWRTAAQREKEAELIFRGEQYARAIGLYQQKMGPGTLPPSIDLLVEQRFLRKKYKDPITNDDFQLLSAGQTAGQIPGQTPGQAPGQARGQGSGQQPGLQNPAGGRATQFGQFGAGRAGQAGAFVGGITGVVSKSTDTSFRLYNNRNKYNEWTFVFAQAAQGRGAAQPGLGGQRQGAPGPVRGQTGRGAGRGLGGRQGGGGGLLGQPPPGGRRGR